ncbi:MAG: AI-2E family transporter [Candidatus Woesearchaeota archaeon]|nr:MAG: AI-2E family transporter [Candidatus Woesearchaeota archaeon]
MVEIKQKYWLYAIITFLVIISLFIIRPYISVLLFAAAIAYVLYPAHRRLSKHMRQGFSAFILTSAIFMSMVIFILYGLSFVLSRISGFYTIFSSSGDLVSRLNSVGLDRAINALISKFSDYIFSMTTKIPHYAISTFVFLIAFYYFLIRGPEIYAYLKEIIPISKLKKDKLFSDIKRHVNAIVYVQLIIGIAQGIVGGIGLFLFGYEFVVVGAIIMAVLGFIPVIGPPLFYAPVAILSIVQGNYFQGIGLLLFGIFLISTIDNIVRPFLVGKKARVHPLIVLLGLFGGVLIFGIAGILVGPIILSITVTLIKDLEKFHVIE